MYLTEVNYFKRSQSAHTRSNKTAKAFHSNKTSCSDLTKGPKSYQPMHRATSSLGINNESKSVHLIENHPEEKWKKILSFFEIEETEYYPDLYNCLLKADIAKGKYRFNIPETVIREEDSTPHLFYTQKGVLTKKVISKSEVKSIILQAHERFIQSLRQANLYRYYGQKVDLRVNTTAPFLIFRQKNSLQSVQEKKEVSSQIDGELKSQILIKTVIRWAKSMKKVQVQSERNFGDNRWNNSQDCLLQRYVYSRNLKAMFLRVSYRKAQRGEQHQEYCLHRFQNISPIFRSNNNHHDFRAKVSPKLGSPNTFETSKITGLDALQKFITPAAEARRLLEGVVGKRVVKLCVDFMEDLVGDIWVIALRGAVFEEMPQVARKEQWVVASEVGYCRLCSGLFQRRELENSVSVRMLLSFLQHLRRRTRVEHLSSLQFESALSLNRKENAMSAVCACCYSLIIHELQLKKYERKLGRLCHIRAESEDDTSKCEEELRQWRLMVYLQEIKETSNGIDSKIENVTVRYSLGSGVEEKWKCSHEQTNISVKKVKIHYFYSEGQDIEEFLRNTEIVVSVLRCEGEEVLAQGSTGILANFKNKFVIESGQRQTTTVLLFFESGKYCELTLKVGLVYDGVYHAPQVPLRKFHSVLLPTRDCLNANPIPKEWMEIFGVDGDLQVKECREQDILKERTKQVGSKLKKKPIRYF